MDKQTQGTGGRSTEETEDLAGQAQGTRREPRPALNAFSAPEGSVAEITHESWPPSTLGVPEPTALTRPSPAS